MKATLIFSYYRRRLSHYSSRPNSATVSHSFQQHLGQQSWFQKCNFCISMCCILPIAWGCPCTRWFGLCLYSCCHVVACRYTGISWNTTDAKISVYCSAPPVKCIPIASRECGQNFTRFLIWWLWVENLPWACVRLGQRKCGQNVRTLLIRKYFVKNIAWTFVQFSDFTENLNFGTLDFTVGNYMQRIGFV
jgi:hypothetical protein